LEVRDHGFLFFLSFKIEKANLAELDWALANMDGQRGRKGVKPSNELVEADAKAVNSKEEVCSLFSLAGVLS
jgi:hypothetical protein